MRNAVITVLCVAVLTPLLVLTTAAAGFGPRHWSGVPLSGLDLPLLDSYTGANGAQPTALDGVTDELIAMRYTGWISVYGAEGGVVRVETTRLDSSLFRALGSRFGGDTVGVVYSPLTPPSMPAGMDDSRAVETAWQRTDPVGTWITLLVGFPWQLGAVLLLTALAWAAAVRRRTRLAAVAVRGDD